jgi:outer membrane protein TolC
MKFQTLRSELAKALFRAALADEAIAIAEQDLTWLDVNVKVVEESYRAGRARLMDVLTLQNEQSKRVEQLKTDRDNRAQALRVVNRFLNRDLATEWPTLQLPPLAGPVAFTPKLVSYAIAQAPELRMMREEIKVAEAAANVARKERWPDVTIGFENKTYARDNDVRSTEVMLGFSIPLGNNSKYRAAIRREEEKQRAVEFEAQNAAQAVRTERAQPHAHSRTDRTHANEVWFHDCGARLTHASSPRSSTSQRTSALPKQGPWSQTPSRTRNSAPWFLQ